jgi:hypothetical protein
MLVQVLPHVHLLLPCCFRLKPYRDRSLYCCSLREQTHLDLDKQLFQFGYNLIFHATFLVEELWCFLKLRLRIMTMSFLRVMNDTCRPAHHLTDASTTLSVMVLPIPFPNLCHSGQHISWYFPCSLLGRPRSYLESWPSALENQQPSFAS